jgi:hypothetical protein
VVLLCCCSTDILCAAPAVAALLNAWLNIMASNPTRGVWQQVGTRQRPINEVYSSDHTHRKSIRLKETRGKPRKAHSLFRRGRGRTPRGKLRRHSQCRSPLSGIDTLCYNSKVIPDEDWYRTWEAGRTIMLRRTSKRVKEVVNKMYLPVIVCLSRIFWDDARNDTDDEKLQIVM